jgi:hypothetical protein
MIGGYLEFDNLKDNKNFNDLRSYTIGEFSKHLVLDFIIRIHHHEILNDKEKEQRNKFNELTTPIFDRHQNLFENTDSLKLLEFFVRDLRYDINSKNEHGLTPLHSFVYKSTDSNEFYKIKVTTQLK